MVIANADRMAVRALHRFAEDYQRKGCPVGRDVDPEEKENEIWRRLTNMTEANERYLDAKERRAGIRNLVEWIEARVRKNRAERRSERGGESCGVESREGASVFGVTGGRDAPTTIGDRQRGNCLGV